MQYRQWCTDPWEPSQRDENGEQVPGIRCLKSIPSANDVPMYVIPSTEKMDLPNLKRDVPGGFGVRLPSSAVSWWEKFLGNAKDLDCVPGNLPQSWLLYEIQEKAMAKRVVRQSEESRELNDQLTKLQNKLSRPCEKITVQGMAPLADHVDNFDSLEEGTMVAVYCPEFKEVPQIGKITKRSGQPFTLHWYEGTWATAWKPMFRTQGRKKIAFEDEQPLEAAICWGFHLNGRRMLNKDTKGFLQDKYRDAISAIDA
ncbi:uncharacterized protein [Ptychodera flava]|uniref:uncharacterized protein n=1 Tax=Ptychodera flava TaxID=63121 RepID=UPI00396A9DA7